MSFRIRWADEAQDTITFLFHGARDRERLDECMSRIDERLRRNPVDESESREGNKRLLIDDALAIEFTIDPAAFRVHILRARRT